MSLYDSWLLEGSEGEPWTEDTAPHGLCEFCEAPMEYGASGEYCPGCEPREDLEYSPVRASFEVVEGKVREL